ncbi:MAG: ferredoxin reductase [Jatrophihabitantaceae bacterium]
MVERGAEPAISATLRRGLVAARALTTPLMPDAYLQLLNPKWATTELRGVIEQIRPETHDSATIVIRPNLAWPGHRAGQYLRLGVEIDGIRYWRAFTLTSDPDHPRGVIAVTVKQVDGGLMSTYLLTKAGPGTPLFLGEVQGEFGIETAPSRPLLMISAGSGVTPMFALLRQLDQRGWLTDVRHLFCVRTPADVIFGRELEQLAARVPGYRLDLWYSASKGRFSPDQLDELCPDWRARQTYLSGPADMIDSFKQHWDDAGLLEQFELERFQPRAGADIEPGRGGTVRLRVSDTVVECDGSTPILQAGEDAGMSLRHGCRMGICHTCIGRLAAGSVRDLVTGQTTSEVGEMVRICVSCPEGHADIEL